MLEWNCTGDLMLGFLFGELKVGSIARKLIWDVLSEQTIYVSDTHISPLGLE